MSTFCDELNGLKREDLEYLENIALMIIYVIK